MFKIQDIDITLAGNTFFFVVGILLCTGYTFYIYRYSLPRVKGVKKYALISLRSFALLLIIFLLTEPTLILFRTKIIEPSIYLFADNSKSIVARDSSAKADSINNFISGLADNPELNIKAFSFSNEVSELKKIEKGIPDFSGAATSFDETIKILTSPGEKKIGAAVILSDGIFTAGRNPVQDISKAHVPVFTIGVGNKQTSCDLKIEKVLFDKYFYANSPNKIKAILNQQHLDERTFTARLFEENKLVSEKRFELGNNEVEIIELEYTAAIPGERKLSLRIDPLSGEKNKLNNRKDFFVNVLKDKLNILMISGSPSADYSFIKSTLSKNKKIVLVEQTAVNNQPNTDVNLFKDKLNKTDLIFFIGFPSAATGADEISLLLKILEEKKLPLFISFSPGLDYKKLQMFYKYLPITFEHEPEIYFRVQPEITSAGYPILRNGIPDFIRTWENLPPVLQPGGSFQIKPGSVIIAGAKSNTNSNAFPLIVTSNFNEQKSELILAGNIWKWQLNNNLASENLFSNFLANSVKWLTSDDYLKKIFVQPVKKIFSADEDIEFMAEIYDDTFTPVNNATVEISVESGERKYQTTLESLNKGRYSGKFAPVRKGEYEYKGTVSINGRPIGLSQGRFSVTDIEIEKQNLTLNDALLKNIASATGGKYFSLENTRELTADLYELKQKKTIESTDREEIPLWSDQLFLIFIIIFLSLEWIIRKYSRML